MVIVNNVYVLACHSKTQKIVHTITSRMIDIIKLCYIKMSPIMLPCKVVIVTVFLYGNLTFLSNISYWTQSFLKSLFESNLHCKRFWIIFISLSFLNKAENKNISICFPSRILDRIFASQTNCYFSLNRKKISIIYI